MLLFSKWSSIERALQKRKEVEVLAVAEVLRGGGVEARIKRVAKRITRIIKNMIKKGTRRTTVGQKLKRETTNKGKRILENQGNQENKKNRENNENRENSEKENRENKEKENLEK